jgi:raffinose/stachyose/melibiose transport system permease protein
VNVPAIGRQSLAGVRRRPFQRTHPVLALPAVALLAVFYLLPNVLNLVLGFTDWNAFREQIRFVGLDNFRQLIADDALGRAVGITLQFSIVVMVVQNLAALGLALALERTDRINGLFRTLFFLPVLISPLAAGFIFRGVLAPSGTVNTILGAVSGQEIDFPWFGSIDVTLYVVALIQAWKGVGITMLIYIAGLLAIPREIEEAARVDGASNAQIIGRIKLPMIAPALTANLVLTLIGSIGAFDTILATTRGGPGGSTAVINLVLYQFFAQGLFGVATAVNLVVFGLVLLASVPLIVYLRRREISL